MSTRRKPWTPPVPEYARDLDCRDSKPPDQIGLSYCPIHETIELWLDRRPYTLSDDVARQLAQSLLNVLREARKQPFGEEAGDA